MPYRSRWTSEQKIAIVMESMNTNISVVELCRKHNVTPNAFYGWKEKFLEAGKLALENRKQVTFTFVKFVENDETFLRMHNPTKLLRHAMIFCD